MNVQVWKLKEGAARKTWRTASVRESDGPSFPADFTRVANLEFNGTREEICEAAFDAANMRLGDVVVLETDQGPLTYVAAPYGFEFVPIGDC